MLDQSMIEKVLNCPALPSLPAVAVRVIELTSDENVKMDDLADTIQNDQALAAQVLRTVNSSFYGLRQRCSTIRKAIVMLGLGPVKSLALSFSLVSSLESDRSPKFEFVDYWRRALYTAVGARTIAEHVQLPQAEEAFLGGLLQDIGMVALYRALGDEYLECLTETEGDHSKLTRIELELFGLQHADLGAMLAQRWRLPPELTLPIKYHERPTAAPMECSEIVRCVSIGNLAHDVLTIEQPGLVTRKFYERAKQWFRILTDDAEQLLKTINERARELSRLFNLDTGPYVDAEAVIRKAEQSLLELSKQRDLESYSATILRQMPGAEIDTDPSTGALGKAGFQVALIRGIDEVRTRREPISLLQIAIEHLTLADQSYGEVGRDSALRAMTVSLYKQVEPLGGVICRVGKAVFTVVLPGVNAQHAHQIADDFRLKMQSSSGDWAPKDSIERVYLTCSVGVSTLTPAASTSQDAARDILVAAGEALKRARVAGGNTVCAAADPPATRAA